ncbi:MAG: hypothetical protein PHX30_02865 [Candidatus Pacebacteria bacterium]|nr:hypothetical protein [Candidatus Paceibacterota bacterium]
MIAYNIAPKEGEVCLGPCAPENVDSLFGIFPGLRKELSCRVGSVIFYNVFIEKVEVQQAIVQLEQYMLEESEKLRVLKKVLIKLDDLIETEFEDEKIPSDKAFIGFYPCRESVREEFGNELDGIERGRFVGSVMQGVYEGKVARYKSIDFFCFLADRDSFIRYKNKVLIKILDTCKGYKGMKSLYEFINSAGG